MYIIRWFDLVVIEKNVQVLALEQISRKINQVTSVGVMFQVMS